MNEELSCPKCENGRMHKFGFIWSGKNRRQRYICRDCHRVTMKPIVIVDKNFYDGTLDKLE
jgi:hypothetical protein